MLPVLTFQDVLSNIPNGVIIVDREGKIHLWNRWMESYTEISTDEAIGENLFTLFPEVKDGRVAFAMQAAIEYSQSSFLSHTIHKGIFPLFATGHGDHGYTCVDQDIHITPAQQDKDTYFAAIVIEDVSVAVTKEKLLKERAREEHELNQKLLQEVKERKQIEKKLRLSGAVIDATMEGVVITDAKSKILSVNPAFGQITGFLPEQAIHEKIKILKSGKHTKEFYKNLWHTLVNEGQWKGEFLNKKPNGELFDVEASITAIKDSNGVTQNYVNVFRDITKRKKNEKLLNKLSKTDPLTELANRRAFDESFEREWRRGWRHSHLVGIALIDVDYFKYYNDFYGHPAGDKCLQDIAKTLNSVIKRADDLVARYGGEEFVVIFSQNDPAGIVKLIESVHKEIFNLRIPHNSSEISKFVTISSGISWVIPDSEHSFSQLLEAADKALYEAKENGRDRIVSKPLDVER